MKNILKICVLLSMVVKTCFADETIRKVAVVVPMQHRAMDDIVRGVKDNLKGKINDEKIIIFNAMGDANNMNATINQVAQNPEYDVIMPIGTNATYLAMGATKDKHIISLASTIDEKTRQKLIAEGHKNVTNVYDEVNSKDILKFISAINKRNILLVFSNDERIMKEVNELELLQSKYDVKIHKFGVSNATDIYSMSSAISNIDCILLLKDHLVVSMVNVITSIASDKNITIVASDEGSVISGADIALGVDEYDIGVVGAGILKEVLDGKKPVDMPVQTIKDIKIFYNKNSRINLDILKVASDNLGYKLKDVSSE